MASVEVKGFDPPEETRVFEGNGHSDIVTVAGKPVGRQVFEPGWKWSENIKPIAGTDSCQVAHVGYCLSGRMVIHMDDGSDAEISEGNAFAIPPGHDAEVVGEENCVLVDFGEIGNFAKRD
jgi:hypothetical protein